MAGASASPRLAGTSLGPGSFGVIGQKPLSSSSPNPARKPRARSPEPADPERDAAGSPAEKARAEQEGPGTPTRTWDLQSPQQSVRIRIAARNLPVGFGASWKQHLAAGSGAVFYEANGICAEERRHHAVYPPTASSHAPECAAQESCRGHPGPGSTSWAPPSSGLLLLRPARRTFRKPVHRHGWCCASWPWTGTWAGQQGVLTTLSSRCGHQARSPTEQGWAQLPEAGVSWLNQNSSGLVSMLRGSRGQKGSAIHRKQHHILQTAHPCPLSVFRGFSGGRHFSQTNELLPNPGKEPINGKDL